MPLIINGVVLDQVPESTSIFFQRFPFFKETASALCAVLPKIIGPIGLLYLHNREYAITVPQDKNITILGTDGATCRMIVVLRHSGSGAVGLGHFDTCGYEKGIEGLIEKVESLSSGYEGRMELSLIGGYTDKRGYSEYLALLLLHTFNKQAYPIELVMTCVVECNTILREGINWPIIYGIGVNIKTGELFPASFPEKGPDLGLRCTRLYGGCYEMQDIYDWHHGLLRIGPIIYAPWRVEIILNEPDDFILQYLSLSPEVESPNFVMDVRSALEHMQKHRYPEVSLFSDNQPRYYTRDENGVWRRFRCGVQHVNNQTSFKYDGS